MAIKVNARETELKFGKEATYHSAMIWKMKQIRRFLRHKKGTQIPWITQILEPRTALRRFYCCARNQSKSIKKIWGQGPEMAEASARLEIDYPTTSNLANLSSSCLVPTFSNWTVALVLSPVPSTRSTCPRPKRL